MIAGSEEQVRELKKDIKQAIHNREWCDIDKDTVNIPLLLEWLYLVDERVRKLEEEKEMKFLKRRKN